FPIEYHPRSGDSKLSSFRDGWRHLRFLLVHSPTYLFIIPGAIMGLLGALICLAVLTKIHIFGRARDIHTMVGGALFMVVGTGVQFCSSSFLPGNLGLRRHPWSGSRARPPRRGPGAPKCVRAERRGCAPATAGCG